MKKLTDTIKLARSGSNKDMMEIVDLCKPMINKYTRLLNYSEDCRSEFILKLIELVKNEIPIDKFHNLCDGVIINYISIAMRHYYITLSIEQCNIKNHEINYDKENETDITNSITFDSYELTDSLYKETLKTILTKREQLCINMIVLQGYTAEQVANFLNVSKQAVNQCKLRAVEKLRSFYS